MENGIIFLYKIRGLNSDNSGNSGNREHPIDRMEEFTGWIDELINGYNDDELMKLIQFRSNFGIDLDSETSGIGGYGDSENPFFPFFNSIYIWRLMILFKKS